jgi:excisionase family DNA binding protein
MSVSDELTTQEVAAMLGVTDRAVLFAVQRGDIPGIAERRGKKVRWRFKRSDIDAYIRSIRQPEGESEA